jgi:hypothetical protein
MSSNKFLNFSEIQHNVLTQSETCFPKIKQDFQKGFISLAKGFACIIQK